MNPGTLHPDSIPGGRAEGSPLICQFLIALGFRAEVGRHFGHRPRRSRLDGMFESKLQDLVHRLNEAKREVRLNLGRNIRQVLLIVLRKNHGAHAHAMRREQLFLHAADGQHLARAA